MFFSDQTPEKLDLKPDEFISRCYVKFEKEAEENKELNRFPNGFVVFTTYAFEQKKKEIDETLK